MNTPTEQGLVVTNEGSYTGQFLSEIVRTGAAQAAARKGRGRGLTQRTSAGALASCRR